MNILSYTHAYYGGGHNAGAETTLHDIMRMLRHEGHSTTALLSKPHKNGSGPYLLDGVKVQNHSSKQDPEHWFPTADIILSHLECAARSGLVGRKYNKPVGHLIHNDQPYCITQAERYADFLVLNTHWVEDQYSHIDVPWVVLHPIIDPNRYKVNSSRQYITLINLSDGTDNRLSYDKGAHTFYEMARRFPNEQFLGVKGAYGYQLIKDLKNVTFMEHANNILEVYRKSKVVLVPSKYESFGRVPVEAAASGIPSVVTRTAGTIEAMGTDTVYAPYGAYDKWEDGLFSILNDYDTHRDIALNRAKANWSRSMIEWDYFLHLLNILKY